MIKAKRSAVLWTTYILAGFLVLGIFFVRERTARERLEYQVAQNYNHAFSELATAVGKLDTALRKASYASSPSMVEAVCAEAYAEALEAQMALGVLPYGNIELEQTASFLTKAGDYVYFLARSAAAGENFSQEQRGNLVALENSAATVNTVLTDLYAQLLSGDVSVDELEQAEQEIEAAEDEAVGGSGFSSGFKKLESEFPELPTLIYDGPFSAHIVNAQPKRLEGAPLVSQETAQDAAADFLGISTADLRFEYQRDGTVPVYVFSRRNGAETSTVEVTKQGGRILFFGTSRQARAPILSSEECVKIAEQFLRRKGFRSMEVTYWEVESGDIVINFAHKQGDIICYPDLIKVSVAMDTGGISGYESLGFIMSHTSRNLPCASVTRESAEAALSPFLTVQKHRLAVIPTSGKNEVLCHEFLCQDTGGSRCLIYVNALTGAEETILLLLEDENGTLTI